MCRNIGITYLLFYEFMNLADYSNIARRIQRLVRDLTEGIKTKDNGLFSNAV